MRLRKIISALLCSALLLCCLASCTGNSKDSENQTDNSSESTTDAVSEIQAESESEKKMVKIACVGDSLTYSQGASDRSKTSYPAVLGSLLGNNYDVRNFGYCGSTMMQDTPLPDTNLPYFESEQHNDALKFEPDIVLIMLGSNDCGLFLNSDHYKDKFIKNAKELIDTFASLPSKPAIYLLTAPDCMSSPTHECIVKIVGFQHELAEQTGLPLIDIYSATEGKNELYTQDTVHLVDAGYSVIANTVYDILAKDLGL